MLKSYTEMKDSSKCKANLSPIFFPMRQGLATAPNLQTKREENLISAFKTKKKEY